MNNAETLNGLALSAAFLFTAALFFHNEARRRVDLSKLSGLDNVERQLRSFWVTSKTVRRDGVKLVLARNVLAAAGVCVIIVVIVAG